MKVTIDIPDSKIEAALSLLMIEADEKDYDIEKIKALVKDAIAKEEMTIEDIGLDADEQKMLIAVAILAVLQIIKKA